LEIINAVSEVTGLPVDIEYLPRRAGDPAVLVASNEKARRVLGWTPKVTNIADMIRTAWNFESKY